MQAVRIATQSEYCHIGVAWVTGGRVFVLEAVSPQVRIFPLSKLLPFYYVEMPNYWNAEVEERALSRVGNLYSKKQAIMAFLRSLKNGADNQWQCAEYTIDVAKTSGVLPEETQATPSAVISQLQEAGLSVSIIR